MAEKVVMLALSPTMENGTIVKWIKNEGDTVDSGDVLCEVETDKTTMEYESINEGTLLKIVLPEGGKAAVGDTIAIIGDKGEDISELLKGDKPAPKGKEETKVETSVSAPPIVKEAVSTARQESVPAEAGSRVLASPLARKMAAERGIDLKRVSGSGPGGRIIKRDIEEYTPTLAAASPMVSAGLNDEEIPVSQKRAIIAQRLAESKYSAPHYYLKLSVEMDGILEARRTVNARSDQKISLNAFLIKFAAEALKRNPMVNSGWQGDTIRKFGSVDIGLAVAQPDGLITPVVRDCANKGVRQIDADLQVLIDKAKNNKLAQEEYTGATFTISNLGSFGIEEFTAIINPPGSAILAVGKIMKAPVFDDMNQMSVRHFLKLTLSCDHRIVDGAMGAAFMKDLKDMMENPIHTLL